MTKVYDSLHIGPEIRAMASFDDTKSMLGVNSQVTHVRTSYEYTVEALWVYKHMVSESVVFSASRGEVDDMIKKRALQEFHKVFYGNSRALLIELEYIIRSNNPYEMNGGHRAAELVQQLRIELFKGL